jgi:hypothetical protein
LASAGHAVAEPEQCSATSHSPTAARQIALARWKPSVGQAVLAPSHASLTSHGPADGRHTAPALPATCWQATPEPSQRSSEHGFPSLAQAVSTAATASGGQLGPSPGHVSGTSHSPAAARHTVDDERNPSAGQLPVEPVHVSATSHASVAARQTVPAGSN